VTLAWDPEYRVTFQRRPYYDPPKLTAETKMMSQWDDAEMHENKTQVYVILDGTGALALGGEPEKIVDLPDGQHNGAPLKGAVIQRVKPGDWIVIPPYTWHQPQPDPGQALVYGMCHIETRNTVP